MWFLLLLRRNLKAIWDGHLLSAEDTKSEVKAAQGVKGWPKGPTYKLGFRWPPDFQLKIWNRIRKIQSPNKSWGYKDVLAGGWRRHNGRDWADPSPATGLSLPRISSNDYTNIYYLFKLDFWALKEAPGLGIMNPRFKKKFSKSFVWWQIPA